MTFRNMGGASLTGGLPDHSLKHGTALPHRGTETEVMTTTGAQAVDRAARLLTCVVESDVPISFTELCEASGLARSTTSRLLAALEANELLQRDEDGAYSSGSLFALYAARHDPWSQLVRVAH